MDLQIACHDGMIQLMGFQIIAEKATVVGTNPQQAINNLNTTRCTTGMRIGSEDRQLPDDARQCIDLSDLVGGMTN